MLDRIYFTANDDYQNFLVFVPMHSSLTLDSNKKMYYVSTGVLPEKITPFDTNFEPTMSKLTNGRVILKFNNSVLVQKIFSSVYSNSMLNLYLVYELNN